MAICCAVLTCHAPVVVPAVGRARAADCAASTASMRQAAEVLVGHRPDVLVVISPHTRRHRTRWALAGGARLQGTFARFGAPDAGVDLPAATSALEALHADDALPTWPLDAEPLDHGALVPLWFAAEAGWNGPTVVAALPFQDVDPDELGSALARAARARGERWAIIASGDMSHRLIPGAPAGHHPRARELDAAVVRCLDAGDLRALTDIDAELRTLAAEDVVDSLAVAAAALGWEPRHPRRLSYEGPFGVGYCQAVLAAESPAG